jgi:plasmid maintenance system antidote protein VapI
MSSKLKAKKTSSKSISSADKVRLDNKNLEEKKSYYLSVLHNEYEKRQEKGPYSLRRFARDLKIHDSIISRIMSGKRLLSYKTALNLISGLNLNETEKQEFLESVESQTRAVMAKQEVSYESMQRLASTSDRLGEGRFSPEELLEGKNAKTSKTIRDARAKIDRAVKLNITNSFLIFTQAIQGAPVFEPFLLAIENFQKRMNARLFIMSGKAHLKALSDEEYPLDEKLFEKHANDIYRQVEVNKYLSAANLDIRPYVVDPLSGLGSLGAEDCRSYIIAHTTQRMKTLPNEIGSHPRIQQCTGAITNPLYRNNKSGLLGDKRHVIGAVIVDVAVNKFIPAAIQADIDGSFIYNGVRYLASGGIEHVRPEAIVRGDDHVGFGDPKANSAVDEMVNVLSPKNILVHDILDAASVSHHRERSIIQTLAVPDHIKTLELELKACREFLVKINSKKPKDCKLYIVPSNHNEHLHRYLDERRWAFDKVNIKKAAELFHMWINEGKDPLVHGVDPNEELAIWLKRSDKAIRIAGVVVSTHGDKGPKGARGSIKGELISYGNSSAGHSHSPEKLFGATRVGTLSYLDLDYTIGAPSDWAHAVEAIYMGRDGKTPLRQLMLVIDGEWRLNGVDRKKVTSTKEKVSKKRYDRKKAS